MTAGISSFYWFKDAIYCEPCVWRASAEAKAQGKPSEYASLVDASICQRCGVYSGDSQDHPVVAGMVLCQACSGKIANWPYPAWLKLSFVGLLLLLSVALLHSRKYFQAGRNLYLGERLVDQGRYDEALPHLQQTLALAPNSDKAALLTAKAALEIGAIEVAQKAVQGHENGHFKDSNDSDFVEVKQMWNRANNALDKADKAAALEKQGGHDEEAAKLMGEAATWYPESKQLRFLADEYAEGAAFVRHDYDKFVTLARKQWSEVPSPLTAASLASALACKFAVTGDSKYREEAEGLLRQAEQLAKDDAEQMKGLREYAERINYRLQSRRIIDTPEYNRQFRSGQNRNQ
jgi:tetratricopeptide (TPR) repeat protein